MISLQKYLGIDNKPGNYIGDVNKLDPINARFTAEQEGVFLFTASVQLTDTEASSNRSRYNLEELQEASVAICIDCTEESSNE